MQSPISKFNLGRSFTQEERKCIVNCVEDGNGVEALVGNAKSKSMSILELPDLSNIKAFCLDSVHKYANDNDIYITESWLTFSMPGEWHHCHNHPKSLVSGVFYVNTIRSLHTIVFPELGEETHNVARGDLLLFPSSLFHYVPENPGNELRISLAFNTSKPTT